MDVNFSNFPFNRPLLKSFAFKFSLCFVNPHLKGAVLVRETLELTSQVLLLRVAYLETFDCALDVDLSLTLFLFEATTFPLKFHLDCPAMLSHLLFIHLVNP